MTSKPLAPVSVAVPEMSRVRVVLHGSERDVALMLLRMGESTAPQIGRELGISQDYVDLLCRSMIKKGAVEIVRGRRIYDLPPSVREQLEADVGLRLEGEEIEAGEQLEAGS